MQSLDWRECHPARLARWANNALMEGAALCFPSGGGPLTVRLAHDAEALSGPLSVLVRDQGAALDWSPDLGPAGRRALRRLWPGSTVLATREGTQRGLLSALPDSARQRLAPHGLLHIRTADHDSLASVLLLARLPLVCAEGEQKPDLSILDEQCVAGVAPIVQTEGASYQVQRVGPEATQLQQRLARLVVFVCTGNTCRSPMAEALFKHRLSERLGCPVDDLPSRGWIVLSAGLAAAPGMPAAPEAVQIVGPLLQGHRSQPLEERVAAHADLLIGMTSSHVRAMREWSARPLSPEEDISDPIGQSLGEYQKCAAKMDECLGRLLEELMGAPGDSTPG